MQNLIDDEILIIETSGEMPEVAYHGSIHYLTADPDGPGITLGENDLRRLKNAAIEGFRRIILRDITLDNRDKGLYRGMERCIVNWRRLNTFCMREGLRCDAVRDELRDKVVEFLRGEIEDAARNGQSCINCTKERLLEFLDELGVEAKRLPAGWRKVICRNG